MPYRKTSRIAVVLIITTIASGCSGGIYYKSEGGAGVMTVYPYPSRDDAYEILSGEYDVPGPVAAAVAETEPLNACLHETVFKADGEVSIRPCH